MNLFQKKEQLNKFDLSFEVKTTSAIGKLIPIMVKDIVPGDKFRINTKTLTRTAPLIAPIMHKIDVYQRYYFVPYRLLQSDYEKMLMRPENPIDVPTLIQIDGDLEREYNFNLSSFESSKGLFKKLTKKFDSFNTGQQSIETLDYEVIKYLHKLGYSPLYYYLGIPFEQNRFANYSNLSAYFPVAYQLIYNYYYKNTLLDPTYKDDLNADDFYQHLKTSDLNPLQFYFDLLTTRNVNWFDDYFTSALPSTQYGSAIDIDIDGNKSINVNEVRAASSLQRYLELLLNTANSYKDYLLQSFGVAPSNETLTKPQYIGGSQFTLNISDVDQTAPALDPISTDLAYQAGKSVTFENGEFINFQSNEHGLLIGLQHARPRQSYVAGLSRELMKKDYYSFYHPLFVNLGMQELYNSELNIERSGVFGYTERYAELKQSIDIVAGDLIRDNYWHLSRDVRFENLSSEFLELHSSDRIFSDMGDFVEIETIIYDNPNDTRPNFFLIDKLTLKYQQGLTYSTSSNIVLCVFSQSDDPHLVKNYVLNALKKADLSFTGIDFELMDIELNVIERLSNSTLSHVGYNYDFGFIPLVDSLKGGFILLNDPAFSNYKVDIIEQPQYDRFRVYALGSSDKLYHQIYHQIDALRPIPDYYNPQIL